MRTGRLRMHRCRSALDPWTLSSLGEFGSCETGSTKMPVLISDCKKITAFLRGCGKRNRFRGYGGRGWLAKCLRHAKITIVQIEQPYAGVEIGYRERHQESVAQSEGSRAQSGYRSAGPYLRHRHCRAACQRAHLADVTVLPRCESDH